jgi:hypothetical protein
MSSVPPPVIIIGMHTFIPLDLARHRQLDRVHGNTAPRRPGGARDVRGYGDWRPLAI